MVTYHGATVDLRISRLLAEGKIIKEYLGILNGSTNEQVFQAKNFPITTDAGVITDLETEVDVYSRDPATLVWTELDDDGSDFDIVGATGTVTVEEDYNQAGVANFLLSMSYYTDQIVSRGQGASIDYARDVEEIHELGDPAPKELKAGHFSVSGTIDALRTTNDLITKALSSSDFYKLPPDFSLYIYPNKNVALAPYSKVTNIMLSAASVKAALKGIMAVNIKYKGLLIAEGTNPA
jgi:hypothetical protein